MRRENRAQTNQASDHGKRESLDALIARHRRQVKGAARRFLDDRLRGRVDASDIAQEVLLEAVQGGQFAELDDSDLSRFLTSVAQRRCIDAHRRHVGAARRTVLRELPWALPNGFSLEAIMAVDSSAPDEKASRRERLRRVQRALAKLSDSDRDLLELRHLRQMSVEAIAKFLNASPTAITTRHLRALQRLRRILASEAASGVSSSARRP